MTSKFFTTAAILLLALTSLSAQASGFDRMMLSNGKMYTVVGVILIIFIGLMLYLYNTDKKLRKIENQIKSNE